MLGLCRLAEDPLDGVGIGMHSGRQPERGAGEVGRDICRTVLETSSCELAERWPHEARKGIGDEGRDDAGDHPRHLVGPSGASLDGWTVHAILLIGLGLAPWVTAVARVPVDNPGP